MKKEISLGLYKKIVENIPIPSIDILIFNKKLDRTLLFLRNNSPAKNEYYSIGGRLHKDETLTECVQRNLEKETGLKIQKNKFFYVGVISETWKNSIFKGVSTHAIVNYFVLKLEEFPKIKLDTQHSKFKWFDVHDKTLHPYIKEKINKSLKCLIENGKK